MIVDRDFCISSYLTFRYVVSEGIAWKSDIIPDFPSSHEQGVYKVRTAKEILSRLRTIVQQAAKEHRTGVLLSSGIDSAIIAALLAQSTRAYTVQFSADWATDEATFAAETARMLGLDHTVVRVSWDDYMENVDRLMCMKRAPLHAAEVGLFMAAKTASLQGIDILFVGNGADSTFGGLDRLLSSDWTFEEFVRRYTFLEPAQVVRSPRSMRSVYEAYRVGHGLDVMRFLKTVHGLGILQMFENAIHAAACTMIAPFEQLALGIPLDIDRIRRGEPKYLLKEVFHTLYPNVHAQGKIAFARPMDQWLSDWDGPSRPEFIDGLDVSILTGEQRWLLFCLERFLNLIETWKGR
ncbi:MAG: asparagine synthase-related protein [Pseudomonadota bacterium]